MLKIGFSCCFFHADPQRAVFKGKPLMYLEQSLAHWVMSEGALAFMIPDVTSPTGAGAGAHVPKVSLRDLVAELDGLVLQGGSDVCPRTYGEEPIRPEWNGDAVRDRYEIALLHETVAQGKPVLGVCRGLQLINVAFAGTLYQDIETQIPGARNHRNWELYDQNFHAIRFEPGTGLAALYPGMTSAKVNTVHHQGIKDVGEGLVVEARCPEDQVIESVRLQRERDWVFGVQWHPEFHDRTDKSLLDDGPILRDFLNEAKKRRTAGKA